MKTILDLSNEMGLTSDMIEPYGSYAAKIQLDAIPSLSTNSPLVVVTAMTPTSLGEGKTTTSIGLVQGLAKIGKRPILTLRQPSIGPVFGIKGGGTGGGKARIIPEEKINLHFTGDAHSVAAAHNLLAALVDSAVYHKTNEALDPSRIEWRRVTNIGDRVLRSVVTGLGRSNGPMREAGFDIDAASEIMAVLALTKDYDDLRERLSKLVVGYTKNHKPVTANDVNAVGPMMVLLHDAMKPNLVQTMEGQPTLVHAGPFGNIAHGCNSILADKVALSTGDITVTEAGFGADLGFEKFAHIKTRASGIKPQAAVIVVTIRALKWHGGVSMKELTSPNLNALQQGMSNMDHAISIVRSFGIPAVVAINRFPEDTPEEITAVKHQAIQGGAFGVEESLGFALGGEGTKDLAEIVLSACDQGSELKYLYDLSTSIEKKVEILAKKVYGASEIIWSNSAMVKAQRYEKMGWGELPICMAKTHSSISANPKLLGRPTGHQFPIRNIRIAAGAGFVYPLAGDIRTLPGLPKIPNAYNMDLDANGNISGMS